MSFVLKGDRLNVEYHENFLPHELATNLFNYILTYMPWKKKSGKESILLGDEGLTYEVSYRGKDMSKSTIPWHYHPFLHAVKEHLENFTKKRYTYCIIQRYPSKVGIGMHRDKEMQPGSIIAGISLGASRTFTFQPSYYVKTQATSLELKHGSLYLINPPTNDYWAHQIEKQDGIRVSLTFRTVV